MASYYPDDTTFFKVQPGLSLSHSFKSIGPSYLALSFRGQASCSYCTPYNQMAQAPPDPLFLTI